MGHIYHRHISKLALRLLKGNLLYQSIHLWSLYPFWQTPYSLTVFSKSHHLGPVHIGTRLNSGPLGLELHEILLHPPPPPFQHQWDCSLIFSQPFPGIPGKVNITSPNGNPWGQVWLLTLNPLWSGRLLSKNRQHLGNLKTHTEEGTCSQTLIHIGKSSRGRENKSLLTFLPKIWYVTVLPAEFHLQN